MPLDQLVIDYRYIYHYASTSYRRHSFHLSIWCYEAWLRVEDMDKLLDVWLNRKNIPGQHNVISLTFVFRTTYWSITPRPSTVSNVRFTFVYDLPRISIFGLLRGFQTKTRQHISYQGRSNLLSHDIHTMKSVYRHFIYCYYIYLISPGHISSLEDNVFDCTVVNDMLLPENIDAKKLFHVLQMNLE